MIVILHDSFPYPASRWQFVTVIVLSFIIKERRIAPLLPKLPLNPVFIELHKILVTESKYR